MDPVRLLKNRRKTAQKAPIEDVVRGALVTVDRFCGKPSCRCRKGQKHRSVYLSQYRRSGSRMIYIPKKSEEEIRRLVRNYKKLKAILDKVSDMNIQLLTRPTGEKKR
jgi:hypothetical protein